MGPMKFGPPPARRKSWLRKRRQKDERKQKMINGDGEEERVKIIEVIPNKTAEVIKRGRALTNIKF